MAAAVTDKFIKGPANKSSTLSSSISDSVQTIPISDLTGVPTDTAVYAAIDAHDSSGTATPSTKEVIKGVVSGSNLINCTRGAEGTAQAHDAGAVVEFFFTAAANNDMVDGITAEHDQDGGHNDITTDTITNAGTLTQTGVATFSDHIDVTDAKSIRDGNNNELVTFSQTSSAVNELTVKNAATGNGPEIQATGGDTNIDVEVIPKGTGKLKVNGNPISDGAWESFTPTINNGSLGNGSLSCEYTQVGKTIIARYNLTFGSTTSVTNTSFSIDLPVTAAANFTEYMFPASISDTGTATIPATARLVSTTAISIAYHDWSGTIMRLLNIGSSTPITWASTDEINALVIYEAA